MYAAGILPRGQPRSSSGQGGCRRHDEDGGAMSRPPVKINLEVLEDENDP